MFERFTEEARQVVVRAQEEARGLGHNYIGTEHILLGLLGPPETVAARELSTAGVTAEVVREQIVRIVGASEEPPRAQIPFTPRAKKVLELSLREALMLRHESIDTAHVLLGLLREGSGVAARILADLGVRTPALRDCVVAAAAVSPRAAGPDEAVRQVLTRAAGRALDDGRTEYTVDDVRAALGESVDPEAGEPE